MHLLLLDYRLISLNISLKFFPYSFVNTLLYFNFLFFHHLIYFAVVLKIHPSILKSHNFLFSVVFSLFFSSHIFQHLNFQCSIFFKEENCFLHDCNYFFLFLPFSLMTHLFKVANYMYL